MDSRRQLKEGLPLLYPGVEGSCECVGGGGAGKLNEGAPTKARLDAGASC